MNEKPCFKQIAIINIVNNIPIVLIISSVAPIIGEQKIDINNCLMNVVIAFIIVCVIDTVVPIPLIKEKILILSKLDKFTYKVVCSIPVTFIFIVIIGLVPTYYNVRLAPVFIAMFIQLYLIYFVVSMIANPIAIRLALMRQSIETTNYTIGNG